MTDRAQSGGRSSSWSPERSAAGGHNPYLIAFVVSIATFMEVLDTTVANVSLRHIAGGLAVGLDESTYVITSYLVANAIVLSISGWLSTVIGRMRFYMLCVATFSVASLFCGLAWNLQSLVLFRVLQGLGGRQFGACFLVMFATGAVLISTTQLLPQLLQTEFGYTAMLAGLVLSPVAS